MQKKNNNTQFKRMIEGLRYLVHMRPDISFPVMYNKQIHGGANCYVFHYINGTMDYGLIYTKESNNTLLTRYSYSDLAGHIDDRKSTGGMVFYLNESLLT